jgi:hypothetical protein
MMPHVCVEKVMSDVAFVPDEVARIALLKSKKWPNGAQLHYAFRGGNAGQRKLFQQTCEELMKYANLDFKLKPASVTVAEIRVTFDRNGGAWSYIGSDSARQPSGQATMNLGFGYNDGQDGTYMHELGHAVGAIHEHQNPRGGIKWNEPNVIRDLSGPPNNWDRQTIQRNMFDKYSATQLNASQFDDKSIMLYAIPASWTLDGFSSRANKVLSAQDKAWLQQEYPGRGVQPPPGPGVGSAIEIKVVSLAAHRDEISVPGERDMFFFNVSENGRYHIEALGGTPVSLRLYGPDSDTHLLNETNNVRISYNAQIVQNLSPGRYFVQISHVDLEGRGKYGLRVLKLEDDGLLSQLTGELTIRVICPAVPGEHTI